RGRAARWPSKATERLQRGRGQLAAERIRSPSFTQSPPRFNGAAANWPRRESDCHSSKPCCQASTGPRPIGRGERRAFPSRQVFVRALQRGRGQLAAERSGRKGGADSRNTASTGPRPIGRGERDAAQEWLHRIFASTGPRPIGRGEK